MATPRENATTRATASGATSGAAVGATTGAASGPATRSRISARIAAVTPSATLAVDAKAKALRAAGADVIGFGAGEPDFPTPEHIVEAAVVACHDPVNHHYTPTAGIAPLREAIAAKTERDSGFSVAPSQVLVTNGAKQAVFEAFATLLDPGDEVLVPAPYWTTYPEVVALAGGVPVAVPTDETTGFHLTVDALEAAVTPATKVLLFVSPNNPTGAVSTPEEVASIGRWAAERGLWVVTDEIYEHLVYGGREFRSMPVAVPELADRCIVINGVAKTYAMTGWRVGWLIGPPDVVEAASNLQSHATSNVSNVSQRAALAALTGDLVAVREMRAAFDRRRLTIHSHAQRLRRGDLCGARGRVLRLPFRARTAGPARWRDGSCPRRPTWPPSPSTRPRWRWCPERPSAPRGTCACPTRSATTPSSRASRASASSSPPPSNALAANDDGRVMKAAR